MERKAGFTYIFSHALNQEIAMSEKTGKVYCEDGTVYTLEEVRELHKVHGEIPLSVHNLKKIFGGTVISGKEKQEKK